MTGARTADEGRCSGVRVDALDTDMRPRVLRGLVTSLHHRTERRMRHAWHARLAMTVCEQRLRARLQFVVLPCQSTPQCAASVFMAGCDIAPHPAMSERIDWLARLKGALRRAAPALDPRQPVRAEPTALGRQGHCAAVLRPGACKAVRPPFPAGLVESIYHPKGVNADTSRKGGLR
jgi:hypothetical protein